MVRFGEGSFWLRVLLEWLWLLCRIPFLVVVFVIEVALSSRMAPSMAVHSTMYTHNCLLIIYWLVGLLPRCFLLQLSSPVRGFIEHENVRRFAADN